ncbi:hypothetical protein ABC383_16530 [Noviherbaspirillum sp. 1P10PC]|uniref:hypothetical protein n=1 Tax=Noviherbaspirillum sp. 1P10PC TaxID=3132292 RepID=UPI00399F1E13
MKNPGSRAGRPEDNHVAAHADGALDEHELDSIVGGDIDYAKWSDAALRQKVSQLTLATQRTINSNFSGVAKDMSHRLYDMETELINRHIYGDYSQPALYWRQ